MVDFVWSRGLRESRIYLFFAQWGCLLVGPESGGLGDGLPWREEVVQEDLVHELGAICPWEEGKAGWRAAIGEPLGLPQALAGCI